MKDEARMRAKLMLGAVVAAVSAFSADTLGVMFGSGGGYVGGGYAGVGGGSGGRGVTRKRITRAKRKRIARLRRDAQQMQRRLIEHRS